jgi:hypothetical protein
MSSREKTMYRLNLYSETPKALKVSKSDDFVHFYLPKSQIDILKIEPGKVTVAVPLWLAEQEGLDPSLDGEAYIEGDHSVIE